MIATISMKHISFFLFFWLCVASVFAASPVSFSSLLDEMTDRAALARFPDPAYTCKQFSSYDRHSTTPDNHDAWFANEDRSTFLREEMNGDRKEWVMMEAEGPGAIVRCWVTAPAYHSTIRVYIDGAEKPVIEANVADLVGGPFLVGPPLSAEQARGRNLYIPIPYSKQIKVTADKMMFGNKGDRTKEQLNLYYQINYRTYIKGTPVKSFSMADLKAAAKQIDATQKLLVTLPNSETNSEVSSLADKENVIPIGGSWKIAGGPIGDGVRGGAIKMLALKLKADDLAQALRSTVLKITFDGAQEPQVYCPVGDFFGSGVGVNVYKSWYNQVFDDGVMSAHWVMPFKDNFEIVLENHGQQAVTAGPVVLSFVTDWNWDDRSMYFHANWRQERGIPTRPYRDWEYVNIAGAGVFVGDVLSLVNHHIHWWGEGDEKIYVDGEEFPSHFGTGTEDYYGYAWCTPQFFETPFHGQPRAEGPSNYGNITNLRVRLLDGIPFQKDFRFDMEVWHSLEGLLLDYAVTTFWYGKPGAAAVGGPDRQTLIAEASEPVAYTLPPYPLPIGGDYTCKRVTAGRLRWQKMSVPTAGTWKDGKQLLWTSASSGDRFELLFTPEKFGKQKLVANLTKGPNYGVVQIWLGEKKIGDVIDLYNSNVTSTGDMVVGDVEVPPGEQTLCIEIVGKNDKATGFEFGTDGFKIVDP